MRKLSKTEKNSIRSAVTFDIGTTYDTDIIIDSLLQKEAYIFSSFQLRKFNEYNDQFALEKSVKYEGDATWKVA